MKKFSFTKCGSSRYFSSGSLAVFNIAAKPLIFQGLLLAACGGEMRSNYFKNSGINCKIAENKVKLNHNKILWMAVFFADS